MTDKASKEQLIVKNRRVTFEAVFDEATGAIVLQYQSIDGGSAREKGRPTGASRRAP